MAKKQVGKSMAKSKQPSRRKIAWWLLPSAVVVVLLAVFLGYQGMTRLEETNTFCGSCHTQPESTYLERYAAGKAVDLATKHYVSKQVGCIGCHAGPSAPGRVAAIMEGAGNAYLYVTRQMVQPARLRAPLADDKCLKCHADVTLTESQDNHFHYLLARWQQVSKDAATCGECHVSHLTGTDPQIAYLDQARTEAVCQRCHAVLAN
jgi:hypothetical protein